RQRLHRLIKRRRPAIEHEVMPRGDVVDVEPSADRGLQQVGVVVDEPRARPAHSWTSSMSVPKLVFGCTNATVVPREPGRGAASRTRPPVALMASSALAQSSTR